MILLLPSLAARPKLMFFKTEEKDKKAKKKSYFC